MTQPFNPILRCLPAALLATTIMLGCGGCGSNDIAEVQTFTMKGVVKDAAGKPLVGVEVFADDTMEYNANALGATDAKGEYVIKLPSNRVTSYRAGAQVVTEWDGQSWRLSLHPDSNASFGAEAGAVRNFTWKLNGPGYEGATYGSTVWVYRDLDDGELDLDQVEVHFEPAGPRIDGSAGEAFTMRLSEGQENPDVPLGRYTVTARNVVDDSVAMKVRVRNTGSFAPSVDAGFESKGSYGLMELEVSSL